MSEAVSLMLALLGRDADADDARAALDDALQADVDPLHWCAVHHGLTGAEVMRRGAQWAGFAFFDRVPRSTSERFEPCRPDMLAQVRMHRLRIMDRDVAFAAPDFFGLLRLASALKQTPDVRRRVCLVPMSALRDWLLEMSGASLIDDARQNMARKWPHAAAQLELTKGIRYAFVALIVVLAVLLLAAPMLRSPWLMPLWAALVILPTAVRFCTLFVRPPPEPRIGSELDPLDLPVYSILVPLRNEANMVDQLCAKLGRLNYPAEKLDIIFVVESKSPSTVKAVRRHLGDARFSLVEVPDAPPRTKPKALNFALPFCQGEFVVVYDAEDRPDPDQLRRIVAQFRRQPEVDCIQARLIIANGARGGLPALFAGDYAGLFAVVLPALARWNLVMPLGGTSNHFRIHTLRGLGGWDAFNVTEDADLAVRLARRKLRCATSASFTLEDAPDRLQPWLGQRTRWMKGWIQTLAVHNRRPQLLLADLGWRGAFMFRVIILGMLLAPLLHVGFLLLLAVLFATNSLSWPQPDAWSAICLSVLGLGYATAIATNLVGLRRTGQAGLAWWQLWLPAYWVLVALATVLALIEFARRPFHWFKTPHSASLGHGGGPDPDHPGKDELAAEGNSVHRVGRNAS